MTLSARSIACWFALSIAAACNAILLQKSEADPLKFSWIYENGLTVIKGYKMCGSTFVGAMWRMAGRHQISVSGAGQVPRGYVTNNPESYYITMVRDPGERCLSEFYYNRGHSTKPEKKREPTAEEKIKKLSHECDTDFETNFIRPQPGMSPQDALKTYRFVAVCDRFDESLLLMGKLFNFSMADMLYLKAKENGHWKVAGHTMPAHVPLSEEESDVQKAAKVLYQGDDGVLLHHANGALDRAAERYGHKQLHQDLKTFQGMLALAEQECRPHFRDGCLSQWHLDTKVKKSQDNCGQSCIDDLALAEGW